MSKKSEKKAKAAELAKKAKEEAVAKAKLEKEEAAEAKKLQVQQAKEAKEAADLKLKEEKEVKAKADAEAKAAKDAEKSNVAKSGKIEVGDPEELVPKELPLVVKLPAGASSAQVAYAKILNSYAYQNIPKWKAKKDKLIKRLQMLEGKELQIPENTRLEINKGNFKGGKVPFIFVPDGKGGEIYAG